MALHCRKYARNRLRLTSYASQSHLVVVGWLRSSRPQSADGCICGISGTGRADCKFMYALHGIGTHLGTLFFRRRLSHRSSPWNVSRGSKSACRLIGGAAVTLRDDTHELLHSATTHVRDVGAADKRTQMEEVDEGSGRGIDLASRRMQSGLQVSASM